MRTRQYVYLCNALDQQTKDSRHITSDSPAATNKVHAICRALQIAQGDATVLSLGRGRQRASGRWYCGRTRVVDGVTYVYAPFWDFPGITHIITALCLVPLVIRLRRCADVNSLIVYNRLPHYLLAVIVARAIGFHCFLDLEDGHTNHGGRFARIRNACLRRTFDMLCDSGAVLAATALKRQTTNPRTQVCYGAVEPRIEPVSWPVDRLIVLYSGSLLRETGATLFIEFLRYLIQHHPTVATQFQFVVTGKGTAAQDIARLATSEARHVLEYRGMVDAFEYQRILRQCHIGMSLKLASEEMGATTYPSKTLEYAAGGLLLVSTIVSDVPRLFDDTAIFIQNETPAAVAEIFVWIAANRDQAAQVALKGQARVVERCGFKPVGEALKDFFDN